MDPIVDDLLELMPDTIRIEPAVENPDPVGEGFGEKTYAAAIIPDPACRIIEGAAQVRGVDGQIVKSTIHVILGGAFGVTVKDRFTLPARFSPNQPKAVAVKYSTDENGTHHETVYF